MSDYYDMYAKVQTGQITEQAWIDYCLELLASTLKEIDAPKPGTITLAGPGAPRWKEIYKMSPPPEGVELID